MSNPLWNWSFKKSIIVATAIGLAAFIGSLTLGKEATVSASQQGTVVGFELPAEAYIGELITVKLVVNNAQNLAGFQAAIGYDPNNLSVSAYSEEGLEAGGRDILLLDPVRREGAIVVGAATCPSADCGDGYARQSRQQARGVDGYAELATLELYTDVPGSYELKLENVKLVDPQGNLLATAANGAVLVIGVR
jgi:hypothetical protein